MTLAIETTIAAIDDNNSTGSSDLGMIVDSANELGNVKMLPWSKVFVDRDFNVRNLDVYETKELADLKDSILRFGLQEAFVVHEEADGRYKVLKGHRRHAAISEIRRVSEELVKLGQKDARDVPFGKIKCEVRKGLSLADQTVIMIDHGQRKGLRPSEVFTAVKRLALLGWGEKAIQNHLAMERGMVTNHFRVTRFPAHIQDEYLKFQTDKKAPGVINFSVPNVTKLYTAYNEDKLQGKLAFGGGPKFLESWETVVEESTGKKTPKGNLKKKLEALQNYPNGHPLFYNFIKDLMEGNDGSAFEDKVINILRSLHEVFPVVEPEVSVTEEGVTREI